MIVMDKGEVWQMCHEEPYDSIGTSPRPSAQDAAL